MALDLSWGAPFTEDDLADRPDDGHRYELVDGMLLVTPAPTLRHQTCVLALGMLLRAALGNEHRVVIAPFDARLSASTVLQPDVLVARTNDVTDTRLEGAPVLAVEVLSASTRLTDLGTKRLVFEEAGVPAYRLGARALRGARTGDGRRGVRGRAPLSRDRRAGPAHRGLTRRTAAPVTRSEARSDRARSASSNG